MEKRGLFISFEGGEGAGKSTQVASLSEWLNNQKYIVKTIREPGGTNIGEEVRDVLKYSKNGHSMNVYTELLLMNACRAQLVGEVIRPALEKGEIVISDRFFDSTTAYQGYARGIDMSIIKNVIYAATQGLKPDLTFLLDVPPQQGYENVQKRLSSLAFKPDRFDEADRKFHELVYDGFRKIAAENQDRFIIIPFRQGDIEGIQREIQSYVTQRLKSNPYLSLTNQNP